MFFPYVIFMQLLHPSYAHPNVWYFLGCTNACVALLQASQAGFMALWERLALSMKAQFSHSKLV